MAAMATCRGTPALLLASKYRGTRRGLARSGSEISSSGASEFARSPHAVGLVFDLTFRRPRTPHAVLNMDSRLNSRPAAVLVSTPGAMLLLGAPPWSS